MAAGGDIRAGRAYVELAVKNSQFMKGLQQAQMKLRDFGKATAAIGRDILKYSAVAAAPFALATRTFVAFEDQMKAVQAITQATLRDFQRLYEQAKKLGRETSYTASQVAGAQLSLGRAGFSPDEIRAATAAMLNLARATGTDLAQSAEIAAGTLRAFGLSADDMVRVADVMVATANNSAQTLTDLGESMKYAAPIAMEYGMSLEDTSKSLGVLANMSIKGAMAGTALRAIMLRLAQPEVQKALGDLGIRATDVFGNLRPLGDVLAEVGQAMAKMATGQRLAFASLVFDKRAAGAALKLAKTDFPALSAAIANAGGTAARTAKIMDSGLGGAFRLLISATEGVQIAIGEGLAVAIVKLTERITPALVAFAELLTKQQAFVVQTAKTIAAIAGIGAGLFVLGTAIKLIAAAIGGFRIALLGIIGPAGLLHIGVTALVVGVVALAAAFINAKLKGITFGQSVLDLTNKITGLDNAYSRLNRTLGESKKTSDIIRRIESAVSETDVVKAQKELEALKQRRDMLQAQVDQLYSKEAYGGTEGTIPAIRKERKERELEWERAVLAVKEFEAVLARAVGIKRVRDLPGNLMRGILGATKQLSGGVIGRLQQAGRVMQETFDAAHKNLPLLEDLARVQAAGIVDPRAREIAETKLDYDAKAREAMKAGESVFLVEQARKQALANIDAKYAKETADERKRIEGETLDEIDRLRIEMTKKGADKELALLKLQQQKELDEARKAGADIALLQTKHQMEQAELGLRGARSFVRGTFSASAVAGMGMGGGGIQERMAKGIEKIVAQNEKLRKIDEDILAEQRRLALEAAA